MGGSLPALVSLEQSLPILKQWQQQANDALALPPAARPPFNLRATGTAGHIVLNWEQVVGADGYEIQSTANGDFSLSATSTVRGANTTTFPDATLQAGDTRWYRVRSTAGTNNNPQVVKGQWSAPVKQIVGGATIYDQVTHLPTWTRPRRRIF